MSKFGAAVVDWGQKTWASLPQPAATIGVILLAVCIICLIGSSFSASTPSQRRQGRDVSAAVTMVRQANTLLQKQDYKLVDVRVAQAYLECASMVVPNDEVLQQALGYGLDDLRLTATARLEYVWEPNGGSVPAGNPTSPPSQPSV